MTKDERKELAALRDEVRKLRDEIAAMRASQPTYIPWYPPVNTPAPWPPTIYPYQPTWTSGRSDQTMIGGLDVTELAKLGSMS